MMGMTARRFEWALRTRGCAVSAWPPGERDAALSLLRRNPVARRLLADAMASEEEEAPEPDAVALTRMQSVVRRALTPPPPVLRGIRWGAIAACAAAGLYLGLPTIDTDPVAGLGPTMQVDSPATLLAALD